MRSLLLALLALSLAACGEQAALDRLADGGVARVTEVRTGDLVVLEDGRVLRLAGVQAPRRDDPHGQAARAALESLVLGREVELLTGGAARDPFGRGLAQLRLVRGRRWVQGALLDAGAVRVRTFADNRALAREMLDREAKARRRGAGLWALPDYRVRLPGEAAPGFQIIEGRVGAVRRGWDGPVLDLDGLEVSVTDRAAREFETLGRPVGALAGRLVRVRGTVRRDGGMRLDHPEALEALTGG